MTFLDVITQRAPKIMVKTSINAPAESNYNILLDRIFIVNSRFKVMSKICTTLTLNTQHILFDQAFSTIVSNENYI